MNQHTETMESLRAERDRLTHLLRDREQEVHALRTKYHLAIAEQRCSLALIETLPDAVILVDLNRTIQFCNQQAIQLCGYSDVHDLIGKPMSDLIVACIEPFPLVNGGDTLSLECLRGRECALLRQDGVQFPTEISSSALTDSEGETTGFILTIHNISGRKRTEQELTTAYNNLAMTNRHLIRSRNLLRIIFDGLEDGLLLLDSRGAVQAVNKALASLLGTTPEKLVGVDWASTYPHIAPRFPGDVVFNLSSHKNDTYQRTRYRRPDGATRILDIRTTALRKKDQSIEQIILHVADVTEMIQLQARVIENERFAASGRLAASVAHEINTPLQALQTFLVVAKMTTDAERDTFLEHAQNELQRVGRIVRQLLDLYRPGATSPGLVDVRVLLERILLLIGKRIRDQKVVVENTLITDFPCLYGRADEMMQVLLNLIVNALDAMPTGGTLHIGSQIVAYHRVPQDEQAMDLSCKEMKEQSGYALEVEISDTGCGINEELQTQIFDPFVTTKEEGTGLGLAISTQIVEQHGGFITVESQPGQGSTFRLVLPISVGALERLKTEHGTIPHVI